MSRTLKLDLKETAEELKDLLKKETNAQIKENLHALYLLKSEIVTTLEKLILIFSQRQSNYLSVVSNI